MSDFNYLQSIIPNQDLQKSVTAIAAGAFLLFTGTKAIRGMTTLIPSPRVTISSFFDFVLSKLVAYSDSVMGVENRRYLPLCMTAFFFILLCNLIGLIPGVPSATTSVWVNIGMALVVFFSFNSYGIKEHGLKGYLAHFAGPMLPLAIIIFPVEIISTVLRILTLNLRLYWNISADHLVLGTFIQLTGYVPFPVFFYLMGTFVAFMQAFVFTTLTMIYILFAVQHEEEGAH